MNNEPYPPILRCATFLHVASKKKQAKGKHSASDSSAFSQLNADATLTILQELLRRHPELRSEAEDLARQHFDEAGSFEDLAEQIADELRSLTLTR